MVLDGGKKMQSNKNKTTYLRLDDQSEEIIKGVMNQKSLSKVAAIRLIIREWAEMKDRYVTIPKIKLEELKAWRSSPEGIQEELDRR